LTNEINKTMKEILKALLEVKKEVGTLSKTETNPFFKSKYFDINSLIQQVEPLLEKNGLLLLQPIENNKVRSVIYHTETGQWVHSEMDLPNLQDPQKLGSAITYYRRYTLQSLLGLQAEDDDGNKASAPVKRIDYISKLHNCKTLAELQKVYTSIIKPTSQEFELKEKLKLTLK
jgi:hypothetical protein